MTENKQKLGLFEGISNADYQKSEGVSSTQLKNYRKAPKIYKAYKDGDIEFNVTPAMELGTAVHKLVLETDDFFSEIIVCPEAREPTKLQRETKTIKADIAKRIEIWDDFNQRREGKLVIIKDVYDKARYMADSIFAHPECQALFQEGVAEQSGWYIDEESGLPCKYRPDWRNDNFLADIKSTRDARDFKFSRAINELGYDISAGHYLAGDTTLKGNDHRNFIFVCVEPQAPYMVAVYPLGERSLARGEKIRRNVLSDLKVDLQSGCFAGYNDDKAQVIDVNEYLLRETEEN